MAEIDIGQQQRHQRLVEALAQRAHDIADMDLDAVGEQPAGEREIGHDAEPAALGEQGEADHDAEDVADDVGRREAADFGAAIRPHREDGER